MWGLGVTGATRSSSRGAGARVGRSQNFRNVFALPVGHIAYAHFHGDHTPGAKAFARPDTKVVARKNHGEEMRKYRLMMGYNCKANQVQWCASLPRDARVAALGVDLPHPPESGCIPPQLTFDGEYSFTEGGVRFDLYITPRGNCGSPDGLAPRFRNSRPLLLEISDAGHRQTGPSGPPRSITCGNCIRPTWLDRTAARPKAGRLSVGRSAAMRARMRSVCDETVKRINDGEMLYQIRQEVRPVYWTVERAFNGVLRQYTGLYDIDPAPLERALADATGAVGANNNANTAAAHRFLAEVLERPTADGQRRRKKHLSRGCGARAEGLVVITALLADPLCKRHIPAPATPSGRLGSTSCSPRSTTRASPPRCCASRRVPPPRTK